MPSNRCSSLLLAFGARGLFAASLAAGALALTGCPEARSATVSRPGKADEWFKRAEQDFADAKVDEAQDAIKKALLLAPEDPEIRMLGGKIALARLEFDELLRLTTDLPGSEAHGLRGRAYWYRGELTPAADELEALLDDPEVRDDWAKAVAGLARKGGGRSPFTISGDPRAVVEMAHVSDVAPYLVVPIEIDGEERLALVATGTTEVVVDSATLAEPSWISVRFKSRRMTAPGMGPSPDAPSVVEVSDVPALTQDLSGVSKEVNAPISALIGVSMLRQLNATIDYGGHQFVVRRQPPSPPPAATRVALYYARGGGMVVSSGLGRSDDARATLFVDSSMRFPLALDERGWVKAGLVPNDLPPVPGDPSQKLKSGMVPSISLGAFHLDRIPGVLGAPIADIEKGLRFDVDGILGAPVLALYRITFGEGGRVMYLEDDTELRRIIDGPDPTLPGGTGPLNQSQPPLGPAGVPGPGPGPTAPTPDGPGKLP